jgi:GxxExxY protein
LRSPSQPGRRRDEIGARRSRTITSFYRGEAVGEFFADFIVEGKIILELEVVSSILAVHRAQVSSYLRATGLQLGLLINFHVPVLHMGVKRVLS